MQVRTEQAAPGCGIGLRCAAVAVGAPNFLCPPISAWALSQSLLTLCLPAW